MPIRVAVDAADRKGGLTLAELAEFVDQAQARGAAPDQVVQARVTFRGRVKSLTLAPRGSDGHR